MKKSLFATILASSAFFVCPAIADTMGTDGDIPADMAANAELLRAAVPVVDGEVSTQGATPVLQEKVLDDCEEGSKQSEPCGGSGGEQGGKADVTVEEAEDKQGAGVTAEL